MILIYLFLLLCKFLFRGWFERLQRNVEERRKLEKYRLNIGWTVGCMNAVQPLQPESVSFWWKPPELSISDEKKRLDQILFDYYALCHQAPPGRRWKSARDYEGWRTVEETRQREAECMAIAARQEQEMRQEEEKRRRADEMRVYMRVVQEILQAETCDSESGWETEEE